MANQAKPAIKMPKMTPAANYRQAYANNVSIRATNWDFLLEFGKIISVSEDGQLNVENEVGIFLSPQQTKALVTALTQTVGQYEKQFGEIVTQPK